MVAVKAQPRCRRVSVPQRLPRGGREGRVGGAFRHTRPRRRGGCGSRRQVRGREAFAKAVPRVREGACGRRGRGACEAQEGGEGRIPPRDALLEGVAQEALEDFHAEGRHGRRVLLADGPRGRLCSRRNGASRVDFRDDGDARRGGWREGDRRMHASGQDGRGQSCASLCAQACRCDRSLPRRRNTGNRPHGLRNEDCPQGAEDRRPRQRIRHSREAPGVRLCRNRPGGGSERDRGACGWNGQRGVGRGGSPFPGGARKRMGEVAPRDAQCEVRRGGEARDAGADEDALASGTHQASIRPRRSADCRYSDSRGRP